MTFANTKPTYSLLFILTLLIFLPFQAHGIIIDFDGPGSLQSQTVDYFEDGFRMQTDSGHYDLRGLGGSRVLNLDNHSAIAPSFPTSQVTFDFFGELFNLDNFEVTEVGTEINTITSSAGGVMNLVSTGLINFIGAEWENLSWFSFSVTGTGTRPAQGTEDTSIDIIELTAVSVPEPSSLVLFGLGGLLLLGLKRFLV